MQKWQKTKTVKRKLRNGPRVPFWMWLMKRSEVWWVNFDPSIGGEIRKKRPAVIISNDSANKFLNRVQVVPLTSKTDRLYPSEALVVLEGKESKAMADQLATVSKLRLFKRAGVLSAKDMQRVEEAVKVQLDIP
jgi:mRNA interferase MazF